VKASCEARYVPKIGRSEKTSKKVGELLKTRVNTVLPIRGYESQSNSNNYAFYKKFKQASKKLYSTNTIGGLILCLKKQSMR